jgi:hypothetical protein
MSTDGDSKMQNIFGETEAAHFLNDSIRGDPSSEEEGVIGW